ncbi:MAG: hypothetical protein HY426_00305 [Candidatus Levybacteria bacterium]|nr:hypothetical protein [Candidatus Levybacteria bacterium]
MARAAQKINATTQKFTEIEDIVEDLVVLSGGKACMVLEVVATNFALQSKQEQQAKVLSYASLLNSLSFPIQIIILSRRLDISAYVKLLEQQAESAPSQALSDHIRLYKDFVGQLVQKNTVLDKKFYIAISFSFLERGAEGITDVKNKAALIADARKLLHSKTASITQELLRIGLKSKILEKNELVQIFYEIYNSEGGRVNVSEGPNSPFVQAVK